MTKIRFSKSSVEPWQVKICGQEYPAILSMNTMAEIEEQSGMPYAQFFAELAKDGLSDKDHVMLICACLHSGGTEVEPEDITALPFGEYQNLLNQITTLMLAQSPDGDDEGEGKKPKA